MTSVQGSFYVNPIFCIMSDNLFYFSTTNFMESHDQYYPRQIAVPSHQTPSSFFSATRPGPSTPLASTQTPDTDRRSSHSHSHSMTQRHPQPASLSPNLQFHTIPSNPQQSPSLPSLFTLPTGTDLVGAENTHLSLPTGFSPSAFGLSPPAFLTDAALNIAPTPPSNPQYATFPFDAVHANLHGMPSGATALTPGAQSQTSGTQTSSEGGALEKDPFLSLLEQLAENENSQGGPSELDFFLTGTGAVEDVEIPEKDATA